MMDNQASITKIELQNARSKTYSLYSDDVFLTEITEDTLVHFALSPGTLLSKKDLNTIIDHDRVHRCLGQAYIYLQHRPHLQKELYRKLEHKKFPAVVIEQAFLHLKKNKYINDDEYIRMFIRDSIRQGKSGPLLIKKRLAEKGASYEKIDIHLDDLFPAEMQSSIAADLLASKNQKLGQLSWMQQKQKLQKFGMSRGFSWSIMEPLINQLVTEQDY